MTPYTLIDTHASEELAIYFLRVEEWGEDGGNTFLRCMGTYTVSYFRRQNYSL
jgi:hypothetical protein